MTSFTFTSDDIKAAPTEVRRWLLEHIEADVLKLAAATLPSPPAEAAQLSACTPEEASRVLDRLGGDFASMQVFIELARETSVTGEVAALHAIGMASMTRHTGLDSGAVISCLQTINRAFQEVRNDPTASLFGLDQADHIYIHQATHHSIRSLWQTLAHMHRRPDTGAEQLPLPAAEFTPPRLGPSEDVAAHQP